MNKLKKGKRIVVRLHENCDNGHNLNIMENNNSITILDAKQHSQLSYGLVGKSKVELWSDGSHWHVIDWSYEF